MVDDLLGSLFVVAEALESRSDRAVGDLEVAAARKLLELHESEVGLDSGGVAVHQETDRSGRRQHRGLRVAVAVPFAEFDRPVPGLAGLRDHLGRPELGVDAGHEVAQTVVLALIGVVGGPAVIPHNPQHRFAVLLELRERAEYPCHLGRGGISIARQDSGQ